MKAALIVLLLLMAVGAPLAESASDNNGSLKQPHAYATRRTSWEGLAIVVNQKNPINNVTLWQLRQIFSGEKRWWANDRRVAPVTMPRGAAERQTVLRVICRTNDRDVDKEFFFGRFRGELTTAPMTLPTPGDIKKFIASTPGGIGYLRASDVDSSLKIVRINGLLPDDDGYPMRLRARPAK